MVKPVEYGDMATGDGLVAPIKAAEINRFNSHGRWREEGKRVSDKKVNSAAT